MSKQVLAYSVDDFQRIAKVKLSKSLYEYLASGTDDEVTLQENRSGFKGWYLHPRVMVPVGKLSTETSLFGHKIAMPVFVSPAGVQALVCPEHGECATARACGKNGILYGLSQHATRSIEQVAEGAPNTLKFYQSYILKDRNLTRRLVRRAIAAGYQGFFVTVDSVRFGYRESDARNGFNALPAPHRLANYDNEEATLDETYNGKKKASWDQNSEMMFEQNLSWRDVSWLKSEVGSRPLIVKGIMHPDDAVEAVEAGADAVLVSNHGGRQLDGALSTIDALPAVVAAVGGRVPVLLDGGVRRGTDILKALALGATAVGIGKPVFFALASNGQDGVSQMLQLMRTEFEAAMAICGVETVSDIKEGLISRHPSGAPVMPRYFKSSL